MEGLNKTFLNSSTLSIKTIFEDIENLPHNEQSVKCDKNDLNDYVKEEHCMKVNDNKDNLPEESNTQTNSLYEVLEDSFIKYSDCGEPIKSQHINIDFTPIPGIDDNAFLQQKCIDFWKFVNEHPKLQSFEIEKVSLSSSNKTITGETSVDQGSSRESDIPAVKVLQLPEIHRKAMATKLKYTICEHSDNDYILEDTKVEQRQVKSKIRSIFSGPQYKLGFNPKSGVKNKSSIIKSRDLDEVKKLCHKMEEWDLSHPKYEGSMEPPNGVPSLNIHRKDMATKLKYIICEHSDNDYILEDTKVEQRQVNQRYDESGPQYKLGFNPKSGVKNKSLIIKSRGLDEVKKLCHKMEEWDLSHPKYEGSMEPPNGVPSLSDF